MKTARQTLDVNGFDFDAFEFENEYSAKNILSAMEEYANQYKDILEKYIKHVKDCEGVDFIACSSEIEFTEQETKTLLNLSEKP